MSSDYFYKKMAILCNVNQKQPKEKIIEEGLLNHYKYRDKINILYFLRKVRTLKNMRHLRNSGKRNLMA